MTRNCFVSFAEKLDGNLSRFFIEMGRQRVSQEEFAMHFFSSISQIIFGLKELSDHGLAHTDLHSENILIKQHIAADPTVQPYLTYTYDNDLYVIDHMDTLCVVWDFGFIGKKGKLLTSHGFSDAFMDRIFFRETQNWKKWKTSLLYDIARLIAHFKTMFETNRINPSRYPIVSAYINQLFMALTSLLNINDNEKNRTEEPLFYLKELFPNLIKDPMMTGWWRQTIKINQLVNIQEILKSYPSPQNINRQFKLLEIESELPVARWSQIVQQQQPQQPRVNPNNYIVLNQAPPQPPLNVLNRLNALNAYNNAVLNQASPRPQLQQAPDAQQAQLRQQARQLILARLQAQQQARQAPVQQAQQAPQLVLPAQPIQLVQQASPQLQQAQQPQNQRYPSDLDAYYGFRSSRSKLQNKKKSNRKKRRSVKKKSARKNRK
jgi:serine/threonine protein kinase